MDREDQLVEAEVNGSRDYQNKVYTSEGCGVGNLDAYRVMTEGKDPSMLTDGEVLLLIMSSTDQWTYSADEWRREVESSRKEAKDRADVLRRNQRAISNNQERSKRAGRTDISRETRAKLPLPVGWRWKENTELTQKQKLAMTRSFQRAEERRASRAMQALTSNDRKEMKSDPRRPSIMRLTVAASTGR